jgi:type IV pilus assembly protein PilQ
MLIVSTTAAQERLSRPQLAPPHDSLSADTGFPPAARTLIGELNVGGAELNDVLRALGERYDVNIISDPAISQPVNLRLSNIPVVETLELLAAQYDLSLDRRGSVFYLAPSKAEPAPPRIRVVQDRLYAELEGEAIGAVIRELQRSGELSILMRPGTSGTVTGYVHDVPLRVGLRTLLETNRFRLHDEGEILIVASDPASSDAGGSLRVESRDSLLTVEAQDAELAAVLRAIGREASIDIVFVGPLASTPITARFSAKEVDDVLEQLLANTPVRFRWEGGTLLIGETPDGGSWTSQIVGMKHARAPDLFELIPTEVLGKAKALVVKEQNSVLVHGPHGDVSRVADFIEKLDLPTPQILIEAIVVDFETTDLSELGVTIGGGAVSDSSFFQRYSFFGTGSDQMGGFVHQGDGPELNPLLDTWSDLLGVGVGHLPDDFVFRIRALEHEGKAKVVSRPQIATLNGHTASLSIGTTQYFILRSTTPLQSPNQIITQESERFERIEANVRLEITPWVNADGEVTVDVHPEFSTPVGQLDANTPPTINSRILDSTVRLRDGETIILGGLIQQTKAAKHNKVPLLGDIPLIGRLFRNKSEQNRTSELIIYITPHIFYGNAPEGGRWQAIHSQLGASEVEGVSFENIEIREANGGEQ